MRLGRVALRPARAVARSGRTVHIAQSEAFSHALREAVAHQTTSFGSEVAAALRRRARSVDDSVGRHAGESSRYGGLVSRAIGLVVDAGIAHLTFLVFAA